MLRAPPSIAALAALFVMASLSACADDSGSTTTISTNSGGASGSSSGGTGGRGGAGATPEAGGAAGSGNVDPGDAAQEGSSADATSIEGSSDDAEAGFVSCAGPSDPVDIYVANLTKLGKNGLLTFRLVESDIAPPGLGVGTWIIKVEQADGGIVSGDLGGHVTMPNHTHPVTVQPEPTYDPNKGAYVATPMYFYLPGYWRATFTAYAAAADAGTPVDTVDFNFCVQ